MTQSLIIEKKQLVALLRALGLEYVETERDFQICIDDGNDSVFYLEVTPL